jgi:MFS family permease
MADREEKGLGGQNTPAPTEESWQSLLTPRRLLLLGLLLGGSLLHAMNVLITATLLPSMVTDVGGSGLMSWVTTAFLASSIVAATATGIVSNMIGAGRGYVAGAAIYGFGSVLCGLSPTMSYVIVGRFVQGLGGGLLSALAYVLVRQLFPKGLWPRVIGFLGSSWSVAILCGPLLGGLFATYGNWRGAFFTVAGVGFLLSILTPYVLSNGKHKPDAITQQPPIVRVALVCAAIAMLSAANIVGGFTTKAVLAAASIVTFGYALRIDRSAPVPLLPSDAFSLNSATGMGLWMILLVSAAYNPILIFGPLFLQRLHGLDPLSAGYIIACASLSWTVVAIAVASLSGPWPARMLVVGPFAMAVGLLGLGMLMLRAPVGVMIMPIALLGSGIGACWAFIAQRVMGEAKKGEESVAASSVITISMIGSAFGAALSGLAANASGLSESIGHDGVLTASFWVPATVVPLAMAASAIALRSNRLVLRNRKLVSAP